jgi:hypothetical protein
MTAKKLIKVLFLVMVIIAVIQSCEGCMPGSLDPQLNKNPIANEDSTLEKGGLHK